jgi:ribulose-5-phosphate 4-epimerase/fuculose-1-phosphate aldolase
MDRHEQRLRIELAAAYRIIQHLGWSELIWTHTSVRLPGPEHHFLLNPYGLRYDEVTASNLVKVDMDGRIIGKNDYDVWPAGFVIHSAVHMARHDIQCVMHTHTVPGMAIAALKEGLLPIGAYSMGMYNRIAYHDYDPDIGLHERQKLAANLGNKRLMILRNHGLLACGHTIAQAVVSMYRLERACQVQIAAGQAGGTLNVPTPDVCEAAAKVEDLNWGPDGGAGEKEFAALVRLMDRIDSSYRN